MLCFHHPQVSPSPLWVLERFLLLARAKARPVPGGWRARQQFLSNHILSKSFSRHPFISASSSASAAVTISPTSASVSEGATQQFTASASATWTASCGTVSTAGLYTPPLANRACTVMATSTVDGSTASAAVTVTSPFTITPVNATTPEGGTQQFTASAPASWSVGCGSITAGGLFTAAAAVGTNCSIEATAASGTKYHFFGNDHITAPVSGGPLTVLPTSATVSEGATQLFTASATATWAASCGSVSSAGLYTAPLSAEACIVAATPTGGGSAASATVTVTSPISITPPSATTPQNSTQQLLPALRSPGSPRAARFRAQACLPHPPHKGRARLSQRPRAERHTPPPPLTTLFAATFTVSPTSATVSEGAAQQFTASASATWTASCGTISSAGLYTPLLSNRACIVTATSTVDGGTASATVTVTSPLTITPLSVNTPQNSNPAVHCFGSGGLECGLRFDHRRWTLHGVVGGGQQLQHRSHGGQRHKVPCFWK